LRIERVDVALGFPHVADCPGHSPSGVIP
jgi:hypothetical protein